MMTMVSPSVRTVASSRALPVASIRLITAGVTASLNRNCTLLGVAANKLPSRGSAETSEACANAAVAKQSVDSTIDRAAIRRIACAVYGFCISLTPGAGHLPSCAWPVSPSAGISIQRLMLCSHSCTTGKYSVVLGLSEPLKKVLMTNSS